MEITGPSPYAEPLNLDNLTPAQQNAVLNVQQQANAAPGGQLGKDEFLRLLVTQLSSQDPLNPMDSTESIAQLAQFSALEQMQNIGSELQSMRQENAMMNGLLLQGSEIEAVTTYGEPIAGIVERATWTNGGMVLYVNGSPISVSQLQELRLISLGDGTSNGSGSTDAPPPPTAAPSQPVTTPFPVNGPSSGNGWAGGLWNFND